MEARGILFFEKSHRVVMWMDQSVGAVVDSYLLDKFKVFTFHP
jgi:hypothetical protein